MSNQLSKIQFCVVMRNGIELWIDEDKAKNLQRALRELNASKFIDFGIHSINTADIVGLFTAEDLDAHTRRKNGQWRCDKGVWHDKTTKCECAPIEIMIQRSKRFEAYTKCGKCNKGYVEVTDSFNGARTMQICDCQEGL